MSTGTDPGQNHNIPKLVNNIWTFLNIFSQSLKVTAATPPNKRKDHSWERGWSYRVQDTTTLKEANPAILTSGLADKPGYI